ncbi:diaminopropionate ammonia-lyase [Rhodoferax sp. U11-2br]|uniref:diaminopropionate ammonia-lyase n=1 Tax=Rhodoferax sp. U11-2br TaxID=2838878 RepID=UPI001BEC77A3|nr:diaminopropionate ammonia-lyase [Rhodoferax sp. U11-2br]MBT3068202.1 diaminopropionate ammonia-lyase [Rhodoferax sp. U11-2br]
MKPLNPHPVTLYRNPRFTPAEAYGADRTSLLSAPAMAQAQAVISAWPGYAPTPLLALPGLARAAGVASIHYKDEAGRFGLGSFKALGGAYAVASLLCRELGQRLGRLVSHDELQSDPVLRQACADITVTCATDGNHGRSVAWGAQMLGCRCVIYIHATVSEGRKQAIARYGAQVVRTSGNYDQAVQQADHDAKAQGWFVISDTSYPGYMDVPRDVMQGYQLMVHEAASALPQWPTHVLVQAGVGGFAAAVCAYFWERHPEQRPVFVVVEPERADCLLQSARAGEVVAVKGDLDTLMAGLACGEVSLLAWQVLASGANAFCTIPDAAAVETMRLLASPQPGDPAIVAGESAVAGLAALLLMAEDPSASANLGLTPDSRVLLFGSEGDTDPTLYQQLVGRSASQVREQGSDA